MKYLITLTIGVCLLFSSVPAMAVQAEENRLPVGTIRAYYSQGEHELSWAVAPNARGRGLGKRMVALLANQITDPIRAEIKADNEASMRIAEYAGMKYVREENGVLHYRREALK